MPFFNLATSLDKLGESAQALVYYERFLQLQGDDDLVDHARRRIKRLSND